MTKEKQIINGIKECDNCNYIVRLEYETLKQFKDRIYWKCPSPRMLKKWNKDKITLMYWSSDLEGYESYGELVNDYVFKVIY